MHPKLSLIYHTMHRWNTGIKQYRIVQNHCDTYCAEKMAMESWPSHTRWRKGAADHSSSLYIWTKYLVKHQHHWEPSLIYNVKCQPLKTKTKVRFCWHCLWIGSPVPLVIRDWEGAFLWRAWPLLSSVTHQSPISSTLRTQLRQSIFWTLISLLLCQHECEICAIVYWERKLHFCTLFK